MSGETSESASAPPRAASPAQTHGEGLALALHAAVMNVSHESRRLPNEDATRGVRGAYLTGHRDARHAIAEMLLTHPAVVAAEAERRRQPQQQPSIQWHDGPPPEADGGAMCLVILREPNDSGLEHYGEPVIIHRWPTKLKTTVHPTRIEYADVAKWAEWPPQPHLASLSAEDAATVRELAALEARATRAPWRQGDTEDDPDGDADVVHDSDGNWLVQPLNRDDDAAFIAAARNALPRLLPVLASLAEGAVNGANDAIRPNRISACGRDDQSNSGNPPGTSEAPQQTEITEATAARSTTQVGGLIDGEWAADHLNPAPAATATGEAATDLSEQVRQLRNSPAYADARAAAEAALAPHEQAAERMQRITAEDLATRVGEPAATAADAPSPAQEGR